jgi:hypothetical protein
MGRIWYGEASQLFELQSRLSPVATHASLPGFSGESIPVEVGIDYGEDGLLVLEWQLLELLEPSEEPPACRISFGCSGCSLLSHELVGRDAEGVCERGDDVSWREIRSLLVVCDHSVTDAGGSLKLSLRESSCVAQLR